MSQKRSTAIFDALGKHAGQIGTLIRDYPAGYLIPLHFHNADQLVYATQGVMTVRTDEGSWVVPTCRAVWIPAGTPHTITMSGPVAMRTLYLQSRLAKALPPKCCVVNVSSLLKELILHACTFTNLTRRIEWQRHLIGMITDQLRNIHTLPLQLPNPSDPRALRIVAALLGHPADRRSLARLCKLAGAGKRTVERLFKEEVGMTFGKWRQQLRLMHAMRLLAEGAKVSHAAMEAGYGSPSAFISMFKRTLGTTPAAYFGMSGIGPGASIGRVSR
jgi:AraC-like DNA-binding protein